MRRPRTIAAAMWGTVTLLGLYTAGPWFPPAERAQAATTKPKKPAHEASASAYVLPPSGLRVAATSLASVTLSWSPPPGAGQWTYAVYVNGKQAAATDARHMEVRGLASATSYKFAVAAISEGKQSVLGTAVWGRTDGGDLLTNGGFERDKDADGQADGWSLGSGRYALVASPVSGGRKAFRLTADKLAKGDNIGAYQRVAVTGGKAFALEGSLLPQSLSGARAVLFVDFFDADGKWAGEMSRELTKTAAQYAAVRAEGIVPAKAAYAFVTLRVSATEAGGSGVLLADDVRLRYTDAKMADNGEPNDAAEQAVPLMAGEQVSYLSKPGDEDWYRYTSLRAERVRFGLTVPAGLDYELEARSPHGERLGEGKLGGQSERVDVAVQAGESVFIRIAGAGAGDYGKQSYRLSASSLPAGEFGLIGSPSASGLQGGDVPAVDGVDVWSRGERFVGTAGAEGRTMSVLQSGGRVYVLIRGEQLLPWHTIYLGTDGDAATGYAGRAAAEVGAEFKIEYNRLYAWDSAAQAWLDKGAAYADLGETSAGFSVYLSDVGLPAAKPLLLAYESADGGRIPAAGAARMTSARMGAAAASPDAGESRLYYPKQLFGALTNPFIGWAPSSRGGDYKQPHALVTASIRWRDLEPERGRFDWAGLERKYDFAKWAAVGDRFILRFVMDVPGDDPNHLDIPDWLYRALAEAEGEAGAGIRYKTKEGAGFSPNYGSPLLIEEHARVIRALAKRYDADPRVAFIQIGSLGHYGEFHTALLEEPFPSLGVSDRYVQAYTDAFREKRIGMRKPFPLAAAHRLGLYNDMFGEADATATWLGWAASGWGGIADYVQPAQAQAAKDGSRMPEWWRYNYSGGEFSSNYAPDVYVDEERLLRAAAQIRASHASWIGATALLGMHEKSGLSTQEQAGVHYLQRLMGYRLVIEQASHASVIKRGGSLQLTTAWSNKGAAPFYYPWPVRFALADPSGRLAAGTTVTARTDIRKWMPGDRQTVEARIPVPAALKPGAYTLLAAIVDPDTGKPGVRLSIEGARDDLWHRLDTVEIR
ncbi:DUF4832 domain-containing protein [Paenibacillus methanolicus]|uniref:Beta-galactosidase-like protein n=1 Tax=Paenibacillus methanolicus TaxID=582686 RepID=A0A5S5BSP8_9BACL|nr:DUF4832 domain-containing protein [Paenibacillus methanolicus]TYP70089.1 beta-galactosidase-like protein [Paenibacillus methanolicus]